MILNTQNMLNSKLGVQYPTKDNKNITVQNMTQIFRGLLITTLILLLHYCATWIVNSSYVSRILRKLLPDKWMIYKYEYAEVVMHSILKFDFQEKKIQWER